MTENRKVSEEVLASTSGGKKEPRTIYRINRKECISCGLCESSCPAEAIRKPDGFHMVISPAMCAGCGLCAGICPKEAIEAAEI